jgi:hypothetical protein
MGKILFFLKKRREFCRFECRKSFPIFIPNVSRLPLLSFYTNSSHQTHLSAPVVNNIPHANLKRRSRLTEASHDFVPPPHFHRAKNVFHATTNFFTIVFFLLVGQRRISICFFANSRNVTVFTQLRYKRDVSRIRLRNRRG